MKQNFDESILLNKETIKQLSVKSDFPAAIKLTLHLSFFAACLLCFANWNLEGYIYYPLLLFFGFIVFSLYAPFHESTHKTAFKTAWANNLCAWLTGITYGYSPGMHEGFHFEHHRFTNQEKDPEKGFSLPDFPGKTFFQIVLAGVLGMLVPLHSLILSFVPVKYWDNFEAQWAPDRKRKAWQWECRLMSLIWLVGFYFLSFNPSLMIMVIVGLFIGRFIHGFITVTEHEGLSDSGHMLYRTRSVVSSKFYRWFWWNINFHAEHHTWPSVPFHQLPKLHELAKARNVRAESSYFNFFLKGKYKE
ncbi:fatty acid desaturase [Echinicola shivajiensis]|uniref:fatty acid desaturase n=1 Tax=Echinicola shivajiensis TaxID=1035916 RepID=UPI001BFCCD0C|nr:fatty acid desaturase [Echinicola shivajiensis]